VTEKDADAPYLLFHFKSPTAENDTNRCHKRSSIARSVSLSTVRLARSLPALPRIHARDGLFRKSADEYG